MKDVIRNRHRGNILATFFNIPGHTVRILLFSCSHRFIVLFKIGITGFLLNALGKDLCHVDSKVSPLGDRADRLALKFLREERGVNRGICYPPIPLKA